MKKIIAIALSATVLFSFASCSKKAEKGEFTIEKNVLKIGTEIGYPPFEYFGDDGKTPLGFDIDLGKAIASKLSLQTQFVDTAWDGIFAGLDTDRYDVIMSAVTITPERLEHYDFTQAYIGNGQSIILRKDSNLVINEPKDLQGLKVGYQSQCSSDFYINKKAAEDGFTFQGSGYDKVMNAYDDLRLGRIDALVSDYLVAVSYLTAENSEFKEVWTGTADEYFAVCVKKGNTALLDKVNEALSQIKESGQMKELYLSTFKKDLTSSIGE
ncbi:MAG: ABC transporter substrate-binding protein [Treponema sp.]|nr:ABC transporter substrate-binding protein [Treponema sp.]